MFQIVAKYGYNLAGKLLISSQRLLLFYLDLCAYYAAELIIASIKAPEAWKSNDETAMYHAVKVTIP